MMNVFSNNLISEKNIAELLSIGEKYMLTGNLWQSVMALDLIFDENPYSLACERCDSAIGSLYKFALSDITLIRQKFADCAVGDLDYHPMRIGKMGEAERVGALACSLAAKLKDCNTDEEFLNELSTFYVKYGVGALGLYKAFYLDEQGEITPVSHFRSVSFDDLWGYEHQKDKIIANTKAFLSGEHANNMLLYGDAGTGKSTSIKALLNTYWCEGLRMIQVQKYQFVHLSSIIDTIRTRNYKFVLFMDDLSFEDFEIEYKYLKAAIEGGLEERPDNMIIFATSNRRHLIKETFDEREGGGDIHRDESVQEKISLSDRFGLQIRFNKPAQDEYFEIVEHLARLYDLDIPHDDLINGARAFSVLHSGMSGRIATQYIFSLLGKDE